ncbi:MAG: Obg family GTPase CgtA [Candidatus Omnitrophota bacterium]
MFIDEAKIYVKAGDGGNGCRSLYRDKYQRQGIPDGGDGGTGADIIAVADRSIATLLDFRYRHHVIGENGKHGSGKYRRGRSAQVLIIRMPCGTIIKDAKLDCCLAELIIPGDQVVLAKGGKGGNGNNRRRAVTKGSPGEERDLSLELKLIADVGIAGFPNSGKSTLVCAISNSHSKTAAYPFTTKAPALGVVKLAGINQGSAAIPSGETERFSFVMADIPGLIRGSHQGRGLGDRFLRHIERTKLIVHMIDMAGVEGRDPVDDYLAINKELALFSQKLSKRQQIIIANKMDLPEAKQNLVRFKQKIHRRVYPVSALKKQGLEVLIEAIGKKLSTYCS